MTRVPASTKTERRFSLSEERRKMLNSRTRLKTLFLGALIGATMSVGVFLFIPPPQDAIAHGNKCATLFDVQVAVDECAKSWDVVNKSEVQNIVMTWCS